MNAQDQATRDLRDRVEDDRGLIKKIELAIPGFRGYRKREDLRIADSLLREQLAASLGKVVSTLEDCRSELTKRMDMDLLEDMKALVNDIQAAENRVRHAEQGYTGISADIRIEEDELNRMYEWDLSLIHSIKDLAADSDNLHSSVLTGDPDLRLKMGTMSREISDFNAVFDRRVAAFAGLQTV